MRYHFHFMAWRRLCMTISGVALLVTIVSLVFQGLNFGIDFTGGLLMDLKVAKPATIVAVTALVHHRAPVDIQVQAVGKASSGGGYTQFVIRTQPISDPTRQAIVSDMQSKYGKVQEVSVSEVQPIIGNQLRSTALLAVALATIGMMLYLAIRFEIRFAVAAVVSLLQVILLTVGLFSVARLTVDEPFIAAVLTVYGYTMNDTIIVFDRIRERLRMRTREPLPQLIDTSINQVLSRSINTHVTVMLALLAVYFLGGASTRSLALALIVGVVFATFSSIFIASPIYLWLADRKPGGARPGVAPRPAKA